MEMEWRKTATTESGRKRRAYIPKPGSEKGRPLAISALEDKIVEKAVKRVLEQIYEPMFLECSYGYREGRSPHQCIDAIGKTIQQKRINHVVEADIRSSIGSGWTSFCVTA